MTRLLPAGFVRPGSSLLETMVSMILFGAVLASVAGALRQHNALAGSQRDRSARGMAVRTTYTILDRELHWLRPPVDVAFDGSVVSIRALRGVGVVCTGRGAELLVRVTGYRAPNPEKDSVIVLGTDHETV
nr:hypothetical protein [Gemmatimonadota bacterium]NIQ53790.1 hypothetical protein [Gemmatimonadota bacterium]NIU73959.1 hypothetical protein [Gammaproteobacteria bacterium]NIX45048.1 hypothetical protein [Gemmatimonadota bacterium]